MCWSSRKNFVPNDMDATEKLSLIKNSVKLSIIPGKRYKKITTCVTRVFNNIRCSILKLYHTTILTRASLCHSRIWNTSNMRNRLTTNRRFYLIMTKSKFVSPLRKTIERWAKTKVTLVNPRCQKNGLTSSTKASRRKKRLNWSRKRFLVLVLRLQRPLQERRHPLGSIKSLLGQTRMMESSRLFHPLKHQIKIKLDLWEFIIRKRVIMWENF